MLYSSCFARSPIDGIIVQYADLMYSGELIGDTMANGVGNRDSMVDCVRKRAS
jgi:hypothetical protein